MHAAVEAAWQQLIESWDDQAKHDAFMGLVAQHAEFAWAAGKYKERTGDAIADRQLEKVRKAAVATMFAGASRKRAVEQPYKRTIMIFALLLVIIMIAFVGMQLIRDTRPHPEVGPRRPPALTKPGRH